MASSQAESDSMTRYKRPAEKREPTSHRLPISTIRKIEMVRKLWQAKAEAEASPNEELDEINDTHVVSTLLAEALDLELQEFGGMPKDAAALEEMVERIKKKKRQ